MKSLFHLTLLALLILVAACQKNTTTPTSPEVADYLPLTVGNQWEYHIYTTNGQGELELSATETLEISGTELINGETYFRLEKERMLSFFFPDYLRVSDQQLVDSEGKVFLSLTDAPEVFERDTVYRSVGEPLAEFARQLDNQPSAVSVPAGDFDCIRVNTNVISFEPDYPYGERNFNDYFAREVGLIQKDQLYYSSDRLKIEIRLNSFSVE